MRWIIDGNNVMGAGGDGWWNDPSRAAVRLTQRIAEWCRTHEDPVTLVFDGSPQDDLAVLGGGNLEIAFATRRGRDAADDRIVEFVDDLVGRGSDVGGGGATAGPERIGFDEGAGTGAGDPDAGARLIVVTSDRGLRRRLPDGVLTEGAGFFRGRIGAAVGGSARRGPR